MSNSPRLGQEDLGFETLSQTQKKTNLGADVGSRYV